MKIQSTILAGLLLLAVVPVFGQSEENAGPRSGRAQRGGGGFGGIGGFGGGRAAEPYVDTSGLSKFSLDFPGGKPKELVAAIQKALGKPLNAIVPDEYADTKLPPLKMANVNAADLFRALMQASQRQVPMATGRSFGGDELRRNFTYSYVNTAFGFKTDGVPTDDSIWYFFVEKPVAIPFTEDQPPQIARFYLLTPYLERGLTVDDITTAIRTGWKMLGDKDTPTISFHKETKLLIAVGEANKLYTIDAALKALEPPQPRAGAVGRFGSGGFGGAGGRGPAPPMNTTPPEQPKND